MAVVEFGAAVDVVVPLVAPVDVAPGADCVLLPKLGKDGPDVPVVPDGVAPEEALAFENNEGPDVAVVAPVVGPVVVAPAVAAVDEAPEPAVVVLPMLANNPALRPLSTGPVVFGG